MTCVVVMWFNFLGRTRSWWTSAIWPSLAITLVSGFHYIWHAARIINEPGQHGRPSAGDRGWCALLPCQWSFFLKYSIVRARPSSSGTFGSQPSSVRARVMSGWRTFGSSVGQRPVDDLARASRSSG